METGGRRPLVWLFVIAGALGAFLYVAVYDVVRVHRHGPSLSGEELLVLARHGSIQRGMQVRCEDHGEGFVGSVVALPGELAIASAGGIHVDKKAQNRFGAPLERLSVTVPLDAESPNVQIAADPGQILVAEPNGLHGPAPRPALARDCLEVVRHVRIADLLSGR